MINEHPLLEYIKDMDEKELNKFTKSTIKIVKRLDVLYAREKVIPAACCSLLHEMIAENERSNISSDKIIIERKVKMSIILILQSLLKQESILSEDFNTKEKRIKENIEIIKNCISYLENLPLKKENYANDK